jgi:hypothetical protein
MCRSAQLREPVAGGTRLKAAVEDDLSDANPARMSSSTVCGSSVFSLGLPRW